MRNSLSKKIILIILSIALCGNLLIPQNVTAAELTSIERLAGDTDYQTAIEIALKINPGIAPAVVLASPDNVLDALVGVPLAKQKEAPLLWLGKNPRKSEEVLNFINEHCDKMGKIYILGNEEAISQSFESALEVLGFNKEQIIRLGGKDAYETAVEVAQRIEYKGNPIYITTGENYSHAISAAVTAGVQESPILFVPSKGVIPKSVINYLNKKVKEGASLQVIGNSKVIPDAVLSEIKSKVNGLEGEELERISGSNIYNLTATLNKQIWMSKQIWEGEAIPWLFITSGRRYTDSISGAVLAAQAEAPLIFVNETIPTISTSLLQNIYKWNRKIGGSIKHQITIIGGLEAIPQETVTELDSLFTFGETLAGKAQVRTYAELNQYSEPSYGVKGEDHELIISDSRSHTLQIIGEDINLLTGNNKGLDEYGRPAGGYRDGKATKAMLNVPKGIARDENGILYVADCANGAIRTVDQQGYVRTLVKGLNHPTDIVISNTGELYVTDTLNHRILKINSKGQWTVLAGGGYTLNDGEPVGAFADGIGEKAQFNEPQGIDIDKEGNIYVADTGNQRIRKVSPEGVVTTIAGSGTELMDGTSYIMGGYKDGEGAKARFNSPLGLAVGEDKVIYVADSFNHCIRKISPEGIVSTLAGSTEPGKRDGLATRTQFNTPSDILIWDNGSLLIVDQGNALLRIYYDNNTVIQ